VAARSIFLQALSGAERSENHRFSWVYTANFGGLCFPARGTLFWDHFRTHCLWRPACRPQD
jgi:hypothetical protein